MKRSLCCLLAAMLFSACSEPPMPIDASGALDRVAIDTGPIDAQPIDTTPDAGPTDALPTDASLDVAPSDAIAARCVSDRDCSGMGLVCDRVRGACVECRASGDCGDGGQICLGARCVVTVMCTTSRTCPGQVCDTAHGYCVDCLSDVDCTTTDQCADGACVPRPPSCRSTRECSPLGLVCDATAGRCVECTVVADCASGMYCTTGGTCRVRACDPGAAECVSGRARVCATDGSHWEETACGAAEVCDAGRCRTRVCAPGVTDCADGTTRRVCNLDGLGFAMTSCASGERCSMGMCLPSRCSPGQTGCANATTRTVCDSDGLGVTPTPCAAREGCSMGACLAWRCTPGTATCASTGARSVCDEAGQTEQTIACSSGESCSGGVCRARVCVPGAVDCADATTRRTCNPDGISYASGSCPSATNASGRCASGACALVCNAGFGDCNGATADGCEAILSSSVTHCGRCGNACPSAANALASCVSGTCGFVCSTGFGDCDGLAANGCEVSLDTNAHCGACSVACTSAQVCDAGRCVPRPFCDVPLAACGARCVNTRSDHLNCGACGNACLAGQWCALGRCVASCPPGTREGPTGDCYLVPTDATACGSSGQCASTLVCDMAMMGSGASAIAYCAAACSPGLTQCGRECVNTRISVANCGACGSACAAGQLCIGGVCTPLSPAAASVYPLTLCGSSAVNLRSDHLNCGACGNVCLAGQWCALGRCVASCPPGTRAGPTGDCYLVPTDATACGSSGQCASTLVCDMTMAGAGTSAVAYCAAACSPGLTQCDRECVNTRISVAHCGACGSACAPGQVCIGGVCTPLSPAAASVYPLTLCGSSAVNLRSDHLNCGACGNVCLAGQWCALGRCLASCPPGTREGPTGDCYLVPTDATACGSSGQCGSALVCDMAMAGSGASAIAYCAATCSPGLTQCDRECVNTRISVAHCGTCGSACMPGQLCVGGVCTPLSPAAASVYPLTLCGSSAVNLRSDHLNCGACGNVCLAGQWCALGRCVASCPPGTRAGPTGDCYLVPTDATACGSSGQCASTLVCDMAMMGSGASAIAYCAAACSPGLTQCDRECVNTRVSVANCGACGSACAAGQLCIGGVCTPLSAAAASVYPLTLCGASVVNLRSDHLNCGVCGNVCLAGQWCALGRCVANCPPGTREGPTGDCYLVPTDATACGSSGQCGSALVCNMAMAGSGTSPIAYCAAACSSGLTQCDRECVNTRLSVAHCGACGSACAAGQICSNGTCRAM